MPKHQKFLKSEKSKVKLKDKDKKLPKGLNVTKTDFKVKKIVINEQIRNAFNADGTVIRKENIKELLLKLQHHNSGYRNEGLRHLKEILTQSPSEASKHFGLIVHGISQLCLDSEKDVRHESFKALSILLSTTTSDTLVPFFDTLSTFLRCAMTHLNVNIQEDSLFMLDNLLLYAPDLVAANSNKIFMGFLDMISKVSVDSKSERTLAVNLSSKFTSVKWRSKVLDRLLGMLKVMVGAKRSGKKLVNDNDAVGTLTLKSETKVSGCHTMYYTDMKPMYFPLTRSYLNRNCALPVVFDKKTLSASPQQLDEQESIQKYAELLIPLMIETWMEVRPPNSEPDISNEAAFTLKISLEILDKIHELIILWCKEENNDSLIVWFREHWNKEFCSNFMAGFPYKQNEGCSASKRKSKGTPTERDVHESGGSRCYQQNLNLSILFCYLNKNLHRNYIHQADQIVGFLKKNLSEFEYAPMEVSSLLVKLLREILIENGENWAKVLPNLRSFLRSVIQTYQHNRFSRDIRTRILILLCDIVLNWKLCKVYGDNSFASWLPTLPTMLCQPYISHHVLVTFSVLAKQNNDLFLKNLEHLVPNVLENLSQIQVTGIDDLFEGKKMIANLLFWVAKWTISQDLSLSENNPEIFKYLQQIATLKEQYLANKS
ncbi:Testis-expressed protein 10 like [Pseudolycoriella hygida]|uniref:Testis-expressed protein 10 like n=1 Tax=Pseudolycoriella hygida TaxID=35572 RepID=A0A9Q0MV57_9DIPT|nr:Testis-expressed protein 10 like [Pseudolycoriella hygida]